MYKSVLPLYLLLTIPIFGSESRVLIHQGSVQSPTSLQPCEVYFDAEGFSLEEQHGSMRVKKYNLDKNLRGISPATLAAFLQTGYLRVTQLSDGDVQISAQTRAPGGGPILAACGYGLVQAVGWSIPALMVTKEIHDGAEFLKSFWTHDDEREYRWMIEGIAREEERKRITLEEAVQKFPFMSDIKPVVIPSTQKPVGWFLNEKGEREWDYGNRVVYSAANLNFPENGPIKKSAYDHNPATFVSTFNITGNSSTSLSVTPIGSYSGINEYNHRGMRMAASFTTVPRINYTKPSALTQASTVRLINSTVAASGFMFTNIYEPLKEFQDKCTPQGFAEHVVSQVVESALLKGGLTPKEAVTAAVAAGVTSGAWGVAVNTVALKVSAALLWVPWL